jgi:hypothetical protein
MSLEGRPRWKAAALLGSAVLLAAAIGFILSRPNAPTPSPPGRAVSPPVITSVPPSASPTIPPHETCAACPMSSFGYALAYFPPARQVLLFGGIDNYANTWLWNDHGWTHAHPSASPPGRFDAAVAYDPVMHVVMVYGGRLAPGQVVDDTWAWDGKTWRELDAGTGSPPPGDGSVMAWDERLATMVLVVPGPSVESPQAETWIWTGTHWSRQRNGDFPTNVSPGPIAYDPVSNSLLGVGLRYESSTSSTVVMLRWDGTAWRELSTSHTPPSIVAGLALDPMSDRLLLVCDPLQLQSNNEAVWMWTGADWQSRGLFLGALQPGGLVTDADDGRVLLFGNAVEAAQGLPQPVHVWEWEGSTWARQDMGP